MLHSKNLQNGEEQFETFKSAVAGREMVQYDYRHTDGELFSVVKVSLEFCRKAKDNWIAKKSSKV
jgi:hypothetical protein